MAGRMPGNNLPAGKQVYTVIMQISYGPLIKNKYFRKKYKLAG